MHAYSDHGDKSAVCAAHHHDEPTSVDISKSVRVHAEGLNACRGPSHIQIYRHVSVCSSRAPEPEYSNARGFFARKSSLRVSASM
eukprot:6185512-Pleurochrysis_carterae.AAC.3